MENTKIGNKEAIALLTTISFNQIIIFGILFDFLYGEGSDRTL